jgi:hypothetical protein
MKWAGHSTQLVQVKCNKNLLENLNKTAIMGDVGADVRINEM